MPQRKLGTYQTQRTLYKRVPHQGNHEPECDLNPKTCDCYNKQRAAGTSRGFTTVEIGKEDVTYQVYLDESKLRYMGVKAAGSKSKLSVDGALSVRVTAQLPAD